jgi:hypothetical protein
MSFFSLFGNKASRPAETLPDHPGFGNDGNTQPISPAGGRRSLRLGQRELLYGAVRDVMLRAGVLVASYRFKVLSLDAQGREYLVMMDLLKADMGDLKRLGEIESMLVQAAKVRHDLMVTGVYWRHSGQIPNVGAPRAPDRVAITPAPVSPQSNAGPTTRRVPRDEIETFQPTVNSVDTGKPDKIGVTDARRNQRASSPEFEDTKIIRPAEARSQLSATQYGDLE